MGTTPSLDLLAQDPKPTWCKPYAEQYCGSTLQILQLHFAILQFHFAILRLHSIVHLWIASADGVPWTRTARPGT